MHSNIKYDFGSFARVDTGGQKNSDFLCLVVPELQIASAPPGMASRETFYVDNLHQRSSALS